jgi:hypothetical protein
VDEDIATTSLIAANIAPDLIGLVCAGVTIKHMAPSDEQLNRLTETIIGCAIEVHRTIGPGLLESVYRECMIVEIADRHLRVESERHIPLEYRAGGSPMAASWWTCWLRAWSWSSSKRSNRFTRSISRR